MVRVALNRTPSAPPAMKPLWMKITLRRWDHRNSPTVAKGTGSRQVHCGQVDPQRPQGQRAPRVQPPLSTAESLFTSIMINTRKTAPDQIGLQVSIIYSHYNGLGRRLATSHELCHACAASCRRDHTATRPSISDDHFCWCWINWTR